MTSSPPALDDLRALAVRSLAAIERLEALVRLYGAGPSPLAPPPIAGIRTARQRLIALLAELELVSPAPDLDGAVRWLPIAPPSFWVEAALFIEACAKATTHAAT